MIPRTKNMNPDSNLRRVTFVTVIILMLGALIDFRLFSISVVNHSTMIAKAKSQYLTEKEMPGRRGKIYAQERIGDEKTKLFPLAANFETYAVSVVPKNVKDPDKTAQILAEKLSLDKKEILEKINNTKLYIPPLKRGLSKDDAEKLSELKISGMILIPEDVRFYPEGILASQILGFVNRENNGQYGIEGFYNEELKGTTGWLLAERDTRGRLINILDSQSPTYNGVDLVLTIDHNVQFTAEEKLREAVKKYEADSGTVVIMDVKTGGIVAMASEPAYDPNKFNEVPAENQNIFLNPAVNSSWEPGSIFKPLIMSIALDQGKVEPDTADNFSNFTVVNGHEIHTAQDKAFGHETMTQVLENSDNVAMVWVSDKLGNDAMYDYLGKFGFGQKTGIDLPGEISGNVMDGKLWKDINRATMSFGQGIAVTPIQVVSAISALADNGKLMQPHMVDKILKSDGSEEKIKPKELRQVISPESAAKITGMMVSVVERGHGKKAGVPGYKIAGKTGTAQVPNPEGGYFEDRHVGSFGGFFPADDPRFAMLVKLDNPKNVEWAESSAAPTFGSIAAWMLNYYQIPPTQ